VAGDPGVPEYPSNLASTNIPLTNITIDWGDGTAPTEGKISPYESYFMMMPTPPPEFYISGFHAYTAVGKYSVTITGTYGSEIWTTTVKAVVLDGPPYPASLD